MPLVRYFAFVGGALLALLLIVDWYLPPVNAEAGRDSADGPIIRIHSVQKWPAAVVFDTTLPTIVPSAPVAVAAETPAPKPPSEAFAMVAEPEPAVKTAELVKSKPRVRRTKAARARGSRVASYDAFGFRNDFFARRGPWSSNW